MTRCSHIQSLITEYLSDELAPLERAIVDDHLAECATCRRELELARELGAALAGLPPASCPERVTRAIHEEIERPAAAATHHAGWWRIGGASGLVAAAILLVVLMHDRQPAPPAEVAGPTTDTLQVAEPGLAEARQEFLWTLAYTASVIDRSEKRSFVTIVRELRARTPDSHTAAIEGGQG